VFYLLQLLAPLYDFLKDAEKGYYPSTTAANTGAAVAG
jgi:hypothetical protein